MNPEASGVSAPSGITGAGGCLFRCHRRLKMGISSGSLKGRALLLPGACLLSVYSALALVGNFSSEGFAFSLGCQLLPRCLGRVKRERG